MSKFEAYDRKRPYNNLPLLPPPYEKIIDIEVLQALNEANKSLAELKGFARTLPNQSMLVNTIALREAKASSEIENIFTTEDELYKALMVGSSELKGSVKEVLFYRQGLWRGFNKVLNTGKFDLDLVTGVYQEIKQVRDGIRPPQTETVILKRGSELGDRSVIYTPPRGIEIITKKLDNLFSFVNDDKVYDYDPLIKLAIFHYQFEAIHPFRDGNGRTGRILSILLMVQKGLLEVPILYLSAYIIRNKSNYYELLNGVTARKDWKNWILYILKAVEETSKYTINKIEEINKLFNVTIELTGRNLPHIRKNTIEKIFEQPYISPKKIIDTNIKSLNTAKKYLHQMEELGIMSSTKIGKEIIYINIDLYNLLSEI